MFNAIYINLPVADVGRSLNFFENLGFEFNQQFTDASSACLIIGENMYAMLSNREKFAGFINKPIASHDSTEAIISLSCKSKESVTELAEKAFSLGATKVNEPEDHGFMYSWGFEDLDGHLWDLFWMDSSRLN